MDDIEKIEKSFNSMFKLSDSSNKFKPIKIALLHYIIGQQLYDKPILNNMLTIDIRSSFGCCIGSGHGKGAINNVVEQSAHALGKSYIPVTSLHEEQILGKKWVDKKGVEKEVRGFANEDFLVKDDALSFINNPKFEIARDYILKALDVYGHNAIYKKLVELDVGLRYFGKCSLLYFIQDSEKIKIENLSSGLFRRAPILKIDFTPEEENSILRDRINGTFESKPQEWFKWLKFVGSIRTIKYNNIIPELDNMICNECERMKSKNILLETLTFANQNTIIKWGFINALFRYYIENYINKKVIEENINVNLILIKVDVEKSIRDYKIVYASIKKFVKENDNIQDLTDRSIIDYLISKKAYNVSTGISGSELRDYTIKTNDISQSTYEYRLRKLKKENRLVSKRGQYINKIWLVE